MRWSKSTAKMLQSFCMMVLFLRMKDGRYISCMSRQRGTFQLYVGLGDSHDHTHMFREQLLVVAVVLVYVTFAWLVLRWGLIIIDLFHLRTCGRKPTGFQLSILLFLGFIPQHHQWSSPDDGTCPSLFRNWFMAQLPPGCCETLCRIRAGECHRVQSGCSSGWVRGSTFPVDHRFVHWIFQKQTCESVHCWHFPWEHGLPPRIDVPHRTLVQGGSSKSVYEFPWLVLQELHYQQNWWSTSAFDCFFCLGFSILLSFDVKFGLIVSTWEYV